MILFPIAGGGTGLANLRYSPAMARKIILFLALALIAQPTQAAPCGGSFEGFLAAFAREAEAAGVPAQTVNAAFAGLQQDQAVLAFDRRQRGTFRKSFEDYVATRVTAGRIKRGTQLLQRHAALFSRIERQ